MTTGYASQMVGPQYVRIDIKTDFFSCARRTSLGGPFGLSSTHRIDRGACCWNRFSIPRYVTVNAFGRFHELTILALTTAFKKEGMDLKLVALSGGWGYL